jgi:meso-butanediol dehydrogenase/(S,S)-butanediol dehydrogenase/diacetyl reductase
MTSRRTIAASCGSGPTSTKEGATFDAFASGAVLGRPQTAEDAANLVSYLAGADSDFMTGQSVILDGGTVFR